MRPYLFCLTTAVLWGLNYHFAKRMVAEADFAEVGFWRYAAALTVLLAVGWRTLPPWGAIKPQLLRITRIGALALFGFNLGYFLGLRTTSALNASLIMALNPATTAALSAVVLGTRVGPRGLLGLGVALAGVAYLIFGGSLSAALALDLNVGDLFILGANVSFAAHHVLVKRDGGALPNATFTLLVNAACFGAFVLVLGGLAVVTPSVSPVALVHSGAFWAYALAFGALGTALAYLLWNAGVTEIGADRAALFLNVAPLATAAGAVALGLELTVDHAVSGALILAGIGLAQARNLPRADEVISA